MKENRFRSRRLDLSRAADISNDEQIESAVEYVASIVGDDGLNLLINNAGILVSEGCKFPQISREVINRHFDVNATSALMLTQVC